MASGAPRTFTFGPCLGRGGFGEVYSVRMRSAGGLESEVAVKVLRADLGAETDAVRRLHDEGRLLARLNHPTILKVVDFARFEGRIALITELVEGADLSGLIAGEAPLHGRALLQGIGAVAAALDAAWSTPGRDEEPLHLVHRDVKPTNIRVGHHGQIKLLDFGIAHFQAANREAKTASDVVVGSMPYMGPERFLDDVQRPASDVYSLGCTLYEAWTGTAFMEGVRLRQLSALALDRDRFAEHLATHLDSLGPDAPGPLREMLQLMLAYDPDDRAASSQVVALCEELGEQLGGATLRMWATDRAWPPPSDVEGELVGRVMTEGQAPLAPAASTRPVSAPPPPRAPRARKGATETLWVNLDDDEEDDEDPEDEEVDVAEEPAAPAARSGAPVLWFVAVASVGLLLVVTAAAVVVVAAVLVYLLA